MAQPVSVKNQSTAAQQPSGAMQPFSTLRQQIDRLFDDFTGGFWGFPFGRSTLPAAFEGTVVPQIDVSESEDSYKVTAELPGLEEKDIDVTIADGVLTIKGEKRAEHEEKKENYYMSERSYGSFSRALRLPDTIDQEKVKASFDKGVLSIKLPKAEDAKSRAKKIEISKD